MFQIFERKKKKAQHRMNNNVWNNSINIVLYALPKMNKTNYKNM